jgi:hypothetical protein
VREDNKIPWVAKVVGFTTKVRRRCGARGGVDG